MNITECKTCGNENVEIRRMQTSNRVDHFIWQCMDCGEKCSGPLKYDYVRSKMGSLDAVDMFDQLLLEKKQRERWEKRQYVNEVERMRERAVWFVKYNEYLSTEKWRDKRRRVLERDNYECQACLKRPATNVHHLTYARVFNEPLFDLISICTVCHEELHPHMKEPENAPF